MSTSTSRAGARALRVVLGLLVGEPPLAAKLLDQGVVGREELQLAVPEEVGAAVADVCDAHLLVLDERGREGRPHAGSRGVGLRQPVDARIGRLGDRAEVGLR